MQKWRSIVLSSRRFAWSVNSVSNKVCAKETRNKQDDDSDDNNSSDDNNNFYHIVILGQVIILDPLVMGIILALLVAYIIRIVRKNQQRSANSRWGCCDEWQILRSRRSYTIIN
jgi:hypothetical protein